MRNGLNTIYASVLIALVCSNTGFSQQNGNSYVVNGTVKPFEQEEQLRTAANAIVWPSTDAASELSPNTNYDWAPPKPVNAHRPNDAALPYSLEDPFLEAIDDDEKEESNKDETDKPQELPGDLEIEKSRTAASSTFDSINPLRRPMSALSIDVRDYDEEKT